MAVKLGPWERGYAANKAPWYRRMICALIGHDEWVTHPRVHDCYRCHAFRRVL